MRGTTGFDNTQMLQTSFSFSVSKQTLKKVVIQHQQQTDRRAHNLNGACQSKQVAKNAKKEEKTTKKVANCTFPHFNLYLNLFYKIVS